MKILTKEQQELLEDLTLVFASKYFKAKKQNNSEEMAHLVLANVIAVSAVFGYKIEADTTDIKLI